MTTFTHIVVIGGSAGSIQTLVEMVRELPPNFSAPICIVVHLPADARSVLPGLLQTASGWPAKHPQTQEYLMPRHIYVAPPDRHMVIVQNRILLHRGAHENRSRPAIDPLFRSAALAFGPLTTAVLLSGYLDDGTAGLLAVKREGGRIIIQDPVDTAFPDMPSNALEHVRPDYVLPAKRIAAMLGDLTHGARNPDRLPPANDRAHSQEMTELAVHDVTGAPGQEFLMGKPSGLTCPQCHGPLWEIREESLVRYRCHEGHGYAPYSLQQGQNDALEKALWSALRALDEKLALNERLLNRAMELNQTTAIRRFQDTIESTRTHALQIRQVLNSGLNDADGANEPPRT